MNQQDQRAAFEAACRQDAEEAGYDDSSLNLTRDGEGYVDKPTQAAWWAWNAAIEHDRKSRGEPVDEALDLLRRAKVVLQLIDNDRGTTICAGGLIKDITRHLDDPQPADPVKDECAALAKQASGQDREDAERLDWLDKTNSKFKMGWSVWVAPAGNVSISSIIQPVRVVTIREAIDAARAAAKGKAQP